MHCPKGIRRNEDGCFLQSCECDEGGEGISGLIFVGSVNHIQKCIVKNTLI